MAVVCTHSEVAVMLPIVRFDSGGMVANTHVLAVELSRKQPERRR